MSKIARFTQKIFASSASNNGVFGSGQAGTKVLSNDPATLMGLSAWAQGWLNAVLGGSKFPPLEEFQALEYINTTQLSYLLQEGIAEYDVGTNYFTNSIVKGSGTMQLFGSLVDNNLGNALPTAPASNSNWKYLIDLANISVGPNPFQGASKNLRGVWASNTTATFTADALILANSGLTSFIEVTTYNKTLNTATSGAGGIDTGALASSTWYHVYAIYNTTGPVVNILFSLSSSAPTLPAGYTLFAKIGTFYSDGSSHIRGFIQIGSITQYKLGTNLATWPIIISGNSGGSPVGTVVNNVTIPSTATKINVSLQNYDSGGVAGCGANANFGSASAGVGGPLVVDSVVGSSGGNGGADVAGFFNLESTSFYFASDNANCLLACLGYQDNL